MFFQKQSCIMHPRYLSGGITFNNKNEGIPDGISKYFSEAKIHLW